jgi:hypothetical protein
MGSVAFTGDGPQGGSCELLTRLGCWISAGLGAEFSATHRIGRLHWKPGAPRGPRVSLCEPHVRYGQREPCLRARGAWAVETLRRLGGLGSGGLVVCAF